MTFKDAYAKLNAAQKEAVDTIDGPLLIIAGPGTGKTQLLTLRAANILQKTDTAPQNILCLTYTDVGARNMRDRLSQFIGKEAYDVKISTYHSFGREITRNYGEYFTESANFEPIDNISQDTVMREVYNELPVENILWNPDVYLKDALAFISECKRADLQPKDLLKIAESNEDFIKKASAISRKELAGFKTINKSSVSYFENLFVKLKKIVKESKLPQKLTPLGLLAINELAQSIVDVDATGKTKPITTWKNKWLIKNSNDEWVFAGQKEVNKLRAGAQIYELYLKKLNNKKLFDYDDMILQALNAIKKHDDLRFTLQEQYQYIMLDEFQDTNLSQLEIIELLTNNPSSNGRPNVMAVGDDDQAIFSFQGANFTNMLRFNSLYKDVKSITLTENWRSHTDILEVGKSIAGQIDDRLHYKLGFTEKLLIAKNPNLPKNAVIGRYDFNSDIAQYAWVAKQVESNITAGTDPSEIAIIAPKHKYLEPLVPYLINKNIPVRYDKRENVLDDANIRDLINMAKLIIALSKNDILTANYIWPSVISGEEWQIPTSKIWKISWELNKSIYSNLDISWQSLMLDDEDLKYIALFFAKLAFIAPSETLETMLDYITGVTALELNEADCKEFTSPYFNYYFDAKKRTEDPIGFTQLLSNLTVLRQHLREYKKNSQEPLVLDDLIEFVAAYNNANEKLLNTSPYHSAENSVQLLTAYGSKGLEFEIVYVLATLDDVWGMKSRGVSSNISLPLNLKIIRQAGASKDERKRLFFVALTRAKHTLIMTSFKQNYAGKNTTRLEFLDEAEEEDTVTSRALPKHINKVKMTDFEAPELESIERFWQNRHFAGAKNPELFDLLKPKLETFQLSATHLNSFTDLVYGGPEKFFINTILKFPKAPTADGQFGNAMHETIDYMQKILKSRGELPEIEEILSMYEQKLKVKKLNKTEFDRLLARGKKALTIFLPEWWQNFNPGNESEKSFKDEGVFIGNAHLTGNLDMLAIDHDDMALRVIDFKTGNQYKRWTNDIKMHKYKQQLLFYKLLIEGSHSYSKYNVDSGRLVFVEPTDDNEIIDLPLEYKKDDTERIKKLIEAVWQRIINLDFPDTSVYEKTLKGTTEFENWLIENASI